MDPSSNLRPPPHVMHPYAAELAAAERAVLLASRLCVSVRGQLTADGVQSKADASPVTVADYGVQALIAIELGVAGCGRKSPAEAGEAGPCGLSHLPAWPLLAEEDAASLSDPSAAPLRAAVLEAVRAASGRHELSEDDVMAALAAGGHAGGPAAARAAAGATSAPSPSAVPESESPAGAARASGARGGASTQGRGNRDANTAAPPRPSSAVEEPYWVLDAIDGTRGFLRGGRAQYAVGLALVRPGEKGGVLLGAMGLPNWPPEERGEAGAGDLDGAVAWGGEGSDRGSGPADRGALTAGSRGLVLTGWVGLDGPTSGPPRQLTARPLSADAGAPAASVHVDAAAARDGLRAATLCVSDHEAWGPGLPLADAVAAAGVGPPARVVPLCCGSLCKYGATALGWAGAFVQSPPPGEASGWPALEAWRDDALRRPKAWDHAAGVAVVLAAGGAATDLAGAELGPQMAAGRTFAPAGGGVVATAGGRVQADVMAAVHRLRA